MTKASEWFMDISGLVVANLSSACLNLPVWYALGYSAANEALPTIRVRFCIGWGAPVVSAAEAPVFPYLLTFIMGLISK